MLKLSQAAEIASAFFHFDRRTCYWFGINPKNKENK